MKELGLAINESLSDSEPIAQAISNIKGAGYDVFLVLEATIGFNKHDEEDDEPFSVEPSEPGADIEVGDLKLTTQDAKFLKALKNSLREYLALTGRQRSAHPRSSYRLTRFTAPIVVQRQSH